MPLLWNHKAKPVRPLLSTRDGTVPGDGWRPCIRLVHPPLHPSILSTWSPSNPAVDTGVTKDTSSPFPERDATLTSCEMLKIVAGVAMLWPACCRDVTTDYRRVPRGDGQRSAQEADLERRFPRSVMKGRWKQRKMGWRTKSHRRARWDNF